MAIFGVQPLQAETVDVFAASSLREATQALSAQYYAQTEQDFSLVFAGSSALARQVSQGAPADVVLLADQDWADWLITQGAGMGAAPFAGNHLVLVSVSNPPIEDIKDLPAMLGEDNLAMAQVDAVPAGRYGKSALEHAGLWDVLSPQIVQAANVRAALRFVERGDVPFGIAYASDLVALPDLIEVFRFAPDSHAPIVYVATQVTPEGAGYMTFLQSDTAQSILQDWGFTPTSDQP